MTTEQKLTGIIIYVILSSIERTEPHGKRGRKAIMKGIKKKLTIEGKKDPEPYLKLVNSAYDILALAKKELEKDNFLINPGAIIGTIAFKYSDRLEPFELKADHIENIKVAYESSQSTFVSMQIANRIMNQIDIYTKEK